MNEIIRTEKLCKSYGGFEAVSSVDLKIQKGEIYGFLGLNGAGKTTTIRMLLGLIKPTSGKVFIHEQELGTKSKEIWKKVGYLVESPHAYPNLTVEENLRLICKLRNIKDRSVVSQIMDQLEISSYSNRKVKHLSLGNNQRLGLAKALIHKPEILILDEPTNGLDPAGIHDIRELLIDLASNHGVTIFISSHILGEIALFATRIGIIHQGSLIQEFDTNQLDQLCDKQLHVQCSDTIQAMLLLEKEDFLHIQSELNHIIIKDKQAIDNPDLIAKLLVDNQFKLMQLDVKEENLESYFLRTIKNQGGGK